MPHDSERDSDRSHFAVRSVAPDVVRFDVHVVPRASRSKLAGTLGDALKVALAAPPVDGEANAELIRVIARALDVPKRAVSITHGVHSKRKVLQVSGVTVEQVRSLVQE